MSHVIIIGGGIGGLSVAHNLIQTNPNMNIEIYEKNSHIGGLARSYRDPTSGCTQELSWRVFFGFYYNLFEIMKDLNVMDTLDEYKHINFSDHSLSALDTFKAYYKIFQGLISCDDRLDDMDDLTWYDSLGTISSSNIFREIGGWLGMDRIKGSYRSVIKVGIEMQMYNEYTNPNYLDYITNKPTSEALFEPWEKFLTIKGVKIFKNHTLKAINGSIKNLYIQDQTGKIITVEGDSYVFALPVKTISQLTLSTPLLQNFEYFQKFHQLTDTCLHLQLAFQVYFNKKISLGDKNAFLPIDTPWDLIVLDYPYDSLCTHKGNVKTGWSITVCTAYIPGLLIKKKMNECSYDEIIKEIWYELINCTSLQEYIYKENGFILSDNLIELWAPMWNTIYRNDKGILTSDEPKFTNNAGSYKLRPSYQTPIKNLFISTAYIKETIDIFSMEAAALAGRFVSQAIDPNSPEPIITRRPLLFLPFRALDCIFYKKKYLYLFLIIALVLIIKQR